MKVKMTSREGHTQLFDIDHASRMCRIMERMKSWPWKLPDNYEFTDGYVKRRSNKKDSTGEASKGLH